MAGLARDLLVPGDFAGLLALGTAIWMNETRPTYGGSADSWGTIFVRYAQLFRSSSMSATP